MHVSFINALPASAFFDSIDARRYADADFLIPIVHRSGGRMPDYIIIKDISYSYPGSSIPVFEDLSISFQEGWTVIAGANGSGKSTLGLLSAGILLPDCGSIRRSGEAVYCPQVFTGLSDEDISMIYSGSAQTWRFMSMLGLTDGMIADPSVLSGGERKRLQLLAALSHDPSILILDEPTNHLDAECRGLILSALSSFGGAGIMISHDRSAAEAISSRTVFLERIGGKPAALCDVPLPLGKALEAIEAAKRAGRRAYDEALSDIEDARRAMRNLSERSAAMRGRLSKSSIAIHDHSAKADVDAARLSGKDRSIDDQKSRLASRIRHGMDRLDGMDRPLMRKEGLSLEAGGYIPSVSFGPEEILAGDYRLSVPHLQLLPGEHAAIRGPNGSGKTLLMEAIRRRLEEEGKGGHLLFIPQEYTAGEASAILSRIRDASDAFRAAILSDIYRLGSDPAFLLEESPSPSPGELKKIDFILSRYDNRNIIMMDEPTNHLDITSMRIFERMLSSTDRSFSLILVSHDDAFVEAACTAIWHVRREGKHGTVTA